MHHLIKSAAVLFGLALCAGASAQEEEGAPMSDDPYLWLEEVEGERALDWVRAENARSLGAIEALPLFEPMREEALAILNSDERVPDVSLRGGYAYNFWQDETHVRGLWRRMHQKGYFEGETAWETVLDLDALSGAEGENWVYKGVSCLAPAFTRCMLTLSRGGSDAAVIREFDTEAKAFVDDGFLVPEAKSSVAWLDADTLLVGTDFGDGTMTESGYARQVRKWSRGQSLSEAETIFEASADDIWSFAMSFYDGESYRGGVFHGETFYDFNWMVLGADGALTRLPFPKKAQLRGVASGAFIVSLNEDWAYKGASFPLGSVAAFDGAKGKVTLLYAPSEVSAVEDVATYEDGVVISLLDDIAGRVVRFEKGPRGWQGLDVDLPEGGVTTVASMDEATGMLIATFEDPLTPETHFIAAGHKLRAFRQAPAFFEAEGMVSQRFEARSSDGTRIPYTVTALQSTLDKGPAPTIQYGYGGFQISILPTYGAIAGQLWLERGGVYVTTNIRGGGEYGPSWHQAGLKTKRQIIYDDFQAISRDLIDRGITTPKQLGIYGGSNGGLLVGVTMTQAPELYGGVAIAVPLLDMLRYDQLLAGASWVGEYGSPDLADERSFLERISPYHNLDADTDYPRALIYTSTKDDRVHPGHARKFAARMDEQEHPFFYYENIEGGHSAAANLRQYAHRTALVFAYFSHELGLSVEAVKDK